MKGVHDQYLFKKKYATEIFECVPEYRQLLVYCRISSSIVGLYLDLCLPIRVLFCE